MMIMSRRGPPGFSWLPHKYDITPAVGAAVGHVEELPVDNIAGRTQFVGGAQ